MREWGSGAEAGGQAACLQSGAWRLLPPGDGLGRAGLLKWMRLQLRSFYERIVNSAGSWHSYFLWPPRPPLLIPSLIQ